MPCPTDMAVGFAPGGAQHRKNHDGSGDSEVTFLIHALSFRKPTESFQFSSISDRFSVLEKRFVNYQTGSMRERLALIVRIRFSRSQWTKVEESAHSCGLAPSVYVRQATLGRRLRHRRHAREKNIAYHLGRIGNNLNQLARRVNSGELVARSEILGVLEQLRAALRRI